MSERMQAVGAGLAVQDYARVAAEPPASTWVTEISTADGIESRLWGAYDQAFAAQHERSLAYRLRPSNEAEAQIVLKYFPTRLFTLKDNATIEVSYAGIRSSEVGAMVPWHAVKSMSYKDGNFGDSLSVTVLTQDGKGSRSLKIKLPKIGGQKKELQATLGAYWQRHNIMSAQS